MTDSETRELKLQRYNKRVFGLKAYTYFWLPLIFLSSAWSVYSNFTSWHNDVFECLFAIFSVALAALSLYTIRGTDEYSFYCNVALLVVCTIRYIGGEIITLASIGNFTNKLQAATSGVLSGTQNAAQQIVSTGIGVGSGIVLFGVIMSLLLFVLFLSVYFYMFFKHKTLFFNY